MSTEAKMGEDEENITDTLREIAKTVGDRIPGPVDWSHHPETPCDEFEVAERFGGEWDKALLEAGIITESEYERFSRIGTIAVLESVISTVKAIIHEEDRQRNPTLYEVVDYTGTPASEFIERFGSWSGTLDAVNPRKEKPECRGIPAAELTREVERVTMKLGRPPTRDELEEVGAYSLTPYRNRFGSVKEAREAADVGHPNGVIREEFLDEVRRVGQEVGHAPETTTFNDSAAFSHQTCYKWFESWNKTLEAAGFDVASEPDRDNLVAALQQLADEVDGTPKVRHIRDNGDFRYEQYLDEFGGIDEAREAAGV